MANPYAIDSHSNSAPMEREEFARLVRLRSTGRGLVLLGLILLCMEPVDFTFREFVLNSQKAAFLALLGAAYCIARSLRCRTHQFERMEGFLRYEEMELHLQQVERKPKRKG